MKTDDRWSEPLQLCDEIRKTQPLSSCKSQESSLIFVVFYAKVRHSPLSFNPKPAFYLPSYLQIEDILSSFFLNVDKLYKKTKF